MLLVSAEHGLRWNQMSEIRSHVDIGKEGFGPAVRLV